MNVSTHLDWLMHVRTPGLDEELRCIGTSDHLTDSHSYLFICRHSEEVFRKWISLQAEKGVDVVWCIISLRLEESAVNTVRENVEICVRKLLQDTSEEREDGHSFTHKRKNYMLQYLSNLSHMSAPFYVCTTRPPLSFLSTFATIFIERRQSHIKYGDKKQAS